MSGDNISPLCIEDVGQDSGAKAEETMVEEAVGKEKSKTIGTTNKKGKRRKK